VAGLINSGMATLQGTAIWRYNSNGMLDSTFGADMDPSDGVPDGFVIYDHDPDITDTEVARAVHIDSSGRILVTGGVEVTGTTSVMTVWRFNQ